MRLASFLLFSSLLFSSVICSAQLVPTGQAIPKRTGIPVVFLNGYQSGCNGGSDFVSNFSSADKVLQTVNLSTVFFDNCSVGGAPSLETIGQAFGAFLAALKYDDGSAVSQVDIVAHSMGGLIARAYLAGKQPVSPAAFQPPATVRIRKAIFLGTPHFGTKVASLFGLDTQTQEMSLGSSFLYDLNTWNQGTDDLRGIDALAIAGNIGTGVASGVVGGYDDGVVSIPSGSVGFATPGRTRIVPYCHTGNFLVILLGACPAGAPALNAITDATSVVSKIMLSFLTGTQDWQTLGQAVEQNTLASASGAVILTQRTGSDQPLTINTATFGSASLSTTSNSTAYSEQVPATTIQTVQSTAVGNISVAIKTKAIAGAGTALVLKDGPTVVGVFPAAGRIVPYSVAPGEFVGIYGSALANASASAPQPYPTQLADAQVTLTGGTLNGATVPLQFAGPGQINSVFPDMDPGLYKLTIRNSAGQHSLNVLVESAAPSLFTQNASGAGAAAALNASSGVSVTEAAPLHSGDYVSLYLTGLGRTQRTGALDYAVLQPNVTVGGQACTVSFAGRNPVFAGLDQINCQIPGGLSAGPQPVVVSSGARVSNTVTLAIQ